MKPFPVPVVGAGSQLEEEPVNYLAVPGPMETFRPPVWRTPASPESVAGARSLLQRLLTQMEATAFDAPALPGISLLDEDASVVGQLNELLGEGEVSCRADFGRELRIQETAFAAVWRVRCLREDGTALEDSVETGAFPQQVLQELRARRTAPASISPAPVGVMNGASLLHEIHERARSLHPGDGAHVVNLTLLPVTDQDLAYLQAELGKGPVTILSRGYGNCRITSTAIARVWWVQYFNSMDQIILNTIEVVDLPEVALAARQDYEDSCLRLAEWIATLDDGDGA